jgi:hypothetical protein
VFARRSSLIEICHCGRITPAKILGETAGIERFKSPDAYARHKRHRTLAGLVIEPIPTPTEPHRQPATQRRHPPHRTHPGALAPARAGHDRQTPSQRRRRPGSPPRAQTPPLRRRLPRAARRHQRDTHQGRLTEEQLKLPMDDAQIRRFRSRCLSPTRCQAEGRQPVGGCRHLEGAALSAHRA